MNPINDIDTGQLASDATNEVLPNSTREDLVGFNQTIDLYLAFNATQIDMLLIQTLLTFAVSDITNDLTSLANTLIFRVQVPFSTTAV